MLAMAHQIGIAKLAKEELVERGEAKLLPSSASCWTLTFLFSKLDPLALINFPADAYLPFALESGWSVGRVAPPPYS